MVGAQAHLPPQLSLTGPGSLTYAGDDAEEVVDALVHRRGDDSHARESIGHRVDAHLRHEQRQQEDLVLGHVVVLRGEGVSWAQRPPPPAAPSQPLTSSTRTAIMAAAPVDTVQSIRITWSSLMSLGSRR